MQLHNTKGQEFIMEIDIQNLENAELTPEVCRELGKLYFFHSDGDEKKRSTGLQLLLKAYLENDPEAIFIIGDLMLKNILRPNNEDSEVFGMRLLRRAANSGCAQARAMLNKCCEDRYAQVFENTVQAGKESGGLVGFDGKPIKIDRKGIFTPVDAKLEYRDGKNVLTLSANILFAYMEDLQNQEAFEQSVLDGILQWQGEYEVFGGQKVQVELHLTTENRLFDNVVVMPLSADFRDSVQKVSNVIGTKQGKEQMQDLMKNRRSFAISGLKWSVNSRKFIYVQSENDLFDDYEEIKHVAKHEFGHTLGLGDLYASPGDQLEGIENGTYRELDSYYVSDKIYNLVMCDHYGPISNNDIEMVILAFQKNKMQLYQRGRHKGKISTALGKGN